MKIVHTLPQPEKVFPDGQFRLDMWYDYAAAISPELPVKCAEDSAGYDFMNDVLPVIDQALGSPDAWQELNASFGRAADMLAEAAPALYGCDPDVQVILYLGLCSGAGWATELDGKPAILLGIEKIIELGWQGETDVKGLICHELGHLWHRFAGRQALPEDSAEERAVTQLYDEGVAMRCEQRLCGDDAFFHQDKRGWAAFCETHLADMRTDYLARMQRGDSTQDFFGDWVRWQGQPDVGYYLGCDFIRRLEERLAFDVIARMSYPDIRAEMITYLSQPG